MAPGKFPIFEPFSSHFSAWFQLKTHAKRQRKSPFFCRVKSTSWSKITPDNNNNNNNKRDETTVHTPFYTSFVNCKANTLIDSCIRSCFSQDFITVFVSKIWNTELVSHFLTYRQCSTQSPNPPTIHKSHKGAIQVVPSPTRLWEEPNDSHINTFMN